MDTSNNQSPTLTTFDKELRREGKPAAKYLDHPQIIDNARYDAASGLGRTNYDNRIDLQRDNYMFREANQGEPDEQIPQPPRQIDIDHIFMNLAKPLNEDDFRKINHSNLGDLIDMEYRGRPMSAALAGGRSMARKGSHTQISEYLTNKRPQSSLSRAGQR